MKYKYTKQEAFDKVVEHLITQGKPAKLGNTKYCSYQTPAGLRCAAGCLIEDKKLLKLAKKIGSWEDVVSKIDEIKKLANPSFIQNLQSCHDQGRVDEKGNTLGNPDPQNWRENWFLEMLDIAEANNLESTKLKKLATKKWRSVKL